MRRTQPINVPGRSLDISLALAAAALPTPTCSPDPTGLFWFSDLTGAFTEISEAAYLLPEDVPGPVLGVAKVIGETCGEVIWSFAWTPTTGEGGAPGIVENDAELVIYALTETLPGLIEVSATCAGQSFGPILLTLLRYSGHNDGDPINNNLGGWLRIPDNFSYTEAIGAVTQYGGLDGTILIGANQVTTLHFGNLSTVTEIFIYANDGGFGYYCVNNDGIQHEPQRGIFMPPWVDSNAPVVSVQGLTALELHSDGYNAPFYAFIR